MEKQAMELFCPETREWFEEALGEPTEIQKQAWPAIASGRHTLAAAPTGTGKTLSAFLVFLDQMYRQAWEGTLPDQLQLIYISPLKALAGDIRENLKRPLIGIAEVRNRRMTGNAAASGFPSTAGTSAASHALNTASAPAIPPLPIRTAIRTGDTPQKERRNMLKHPPHILITTPESLFLLLTGKDGKQMLRTAKAVIVDELHALIDTKRGAHLMLSLARLDAMKTSDGGKALQRIGLSATIDPLELAAAYLAPEPAVIAAPKMKKAVRIEIADCQPEWRGGKKRTVWETIAEQIYDRCRNTKSVIVFLEGRRAAEKLAFQVNLLGGEGFARTHHGSMSREQRLEAEEDLRNGKLRLLCATSSMELGIDVGDIEQVLQVGCPKSVSSMLQRLGRAGHNPDRTSVMIVYPKTAAEALYCALTAETARQGLVEKMHPPRLCLDVLAQHLVSMAVGDGYEETEVMEILQRAWPFREVSREEVQRILKMLAGDYEHAREIPVRPRILYDRIHEKVNGDAYSRMLAVSAGGTIPDRGLFTVRTEGGVKLGEVDEEFVYEARIGDRFLLGAFAWKILRQDKDNVYVEPTSVSGAKPPFWKGDWSGRDLETSRAFGAVLRRLEAAYEKGCLEEALCSLGLELTAAQSVEDLLTRQIRSAGCLPDDRTILVEHMTDSAGNHQMMVHSILGKRVNAPLALLAELAARKELQEHVNSVEEENGFLLYSYSNRELPEKLLFCLKPEEARQTLEAALAQTAMFSMAFRYNAARALMMGAGTKGRKPLWQQRMRGAGMMEPLMAVPDHPLIQETRRECLEDQWDIAGVETVLQGIQDGTIEVKEIFTEIPSPLSMPLQWQVEAAEMYNYTPMPAGVTEHTVEALKQAQMIRPDAALLERVPERKKLPENEEQLHSLLMAEGDLLAGELAVPGEWLETLAGRGLVCYIEPGLWIAAEQEEEYRLALEMDSAQEEKGWEAAQHIVRRALRFRGAMNFGQLRERYVFSEERLEEILRRLCGAESIVCQDDFYYHAEWYDRARRETLKSRRQEIKTLPAERFASYLSRKAMPHGTPEEQLKQTIRDLIGLTFPAAVWETILLPGRVNQYRPALLDALLAQGGVFWQMDGKGGLSFHRQEEIDWDRSFWKEQEMEPEEKERILLGALEKRGASFLQSLNGLLENESPHDTLLSLAAKGMVKADSFVPVRQWLEQDKKKPVSARQRAGMRVKALQAGRWELARPVKMQKTEIKLAGVFDRMGLVCRETAAGISWPEALALLRVQEYTGQVRRGYFIEGLSGAQFIRTEEFARMQRDLQETEEETVWISALDPAQIWGKVVPHRPGKQFLNIAGTAAALRDGVPIAVLERQGKVLRILKDGGFAANEEADSILCDALRLFAEAFRRGRMFPDCKRMVLKEYPKEMGELLRAAGFQKEMQDYVLYR